MNFIKRLFRLFRRRDYMMYTKPCPRCGGRHIRFKPSGQVSFNRIICDDCGFTLENLLADSLLDDWEWIPRKKEDKS